MTILQATRTKTSAGDTRSGRLLLIELSGNRSHSMNPDGLNRRTIVMDCRYPDGIVVDAEAAISTGPTLVSPTSTTARSNVPTCEGRNRRVIVLQGVTHTETNPPR